MLSAECIRELQSSWFPNMTDAGLRRLVELLEQNSPLLIHGSFTQAVPMGCLATQAGWNHPRAARYTQEAGIIWLGEVVGLNPATSSVIREWDAATTCHKRYTLRQELLVHFHEEAERRQQTNPCPARVANLIEV